MDGSISFPMHCFSMGCCYPSSTEESLERRGNVPLPLPENLVRHQYAVKPLSRLQDSIISGPPFETNIHLSNLWLLSFFLLDFGYLWWRCVSFWRLRTMITISFLSDRWVYELKAWLFIHRFMLSIAGFGAFHYCSSHDWCSEKRPSLLGLVHKSDVDSLNCRQAAQRIAFDETIIYTYWGRFHGQLPGWTWHEGSYCDKWFCWWRDHLA